MGFENHEIATMPGASDWLEYAGFTLDIDPKAKHGKVFEFKDSVTGDVLANRTFLVKNNGTIHRSKTDSNGRAIIEASAGHQISIHLVFSSPVSEFCCKA